jgi:UPF0755 protein
VSGRSDAEREAARLERARRRAERTDEPDQSDAAGALETRSVSAEPDPDPEFEPSLESEWGEDGYEEDRYEDGYEEDGYEEEYDDAELPAGTRRITRLQRQDPRGKREKATRKKRKPLKRQRRWRKWVGRAFVLGVMLLAAAVIWFFIELFQPFHGSGHGTVRVTIPAHSSAKQIGNILERDGVIASSFFFNVRATIGSDRSDLRSGTYVMKLDMPYSAVLDQLTKPPKAAKTSNLTITEGRTRRQIDALLRTQRVKGSYYADTRHSSLLDPHAYGAPRNVNSLEGFLFPSTYQVRDPISIPDLVADQLKTFKQRFSGVNLSYAKKKNLTPYDVLIIASMVEAEAKTEHDRPLVAAVIYNRLRAGMPLQIDATSRYITGNYTQSLTASQLNSSSPYNTRIHKGLPPTPIGNPGMPSIQAAAHPASVNYLYYVAKVCGNGNQSFTASYAQFNQWAQQYQAVRARNGGRLPHC